MKISNQNAIFLLMLVASGLSNNVSAADSIDAAKSAVGKAAVTANTTTSATAGASASTTAASSSSEAITGGGKPAPGEDEDVKIPKNFIHSSTLVTSTNCKIKCLDPHAETEESAQVIDILQKIYVAYAEKNLDYIGKHLAQDCITFYEGDKKVISGKKAALDDIKEWTDKESQNTEAPLLEIILEHPYCNINQDHAVVTFTAIKELGGAHPSKSKSHCNDVFKREGDTWTLLTHYRSSWKELN